MMGSLLPPNSTPHERALAGAAARLLSVPNPIETLWDANRCPTHLLPWLAWSLSVDTWDTSWTESQKRAVIRASVEVHRLKGTKAAVLAALQALDVGTEIIEWWEPRARIGAAPKTFEIWLDLMSVLRDGGDVVATLARLRRSVDAAKPVAAHYTAHARIKSRASLYCGINIRMTGRLRTMATLPPFPVVEATAKSFAIISGKGRLVTPIVEAP